MDMLAKSKVKYIQTLGQKKSRNEGMEFIAEGPKIVKELLETSTAQVTAIYALKDWIEVNKKLLSKQHVVKISSDELQKISQLVTPNLVLAVVKKFDEVVAVQTKGTITLALD